MPRCLAHLTGHHDKGCSEPVAAEHLALGTDEGQVKAHWRRRREIWPGSGRLVVKFLVTIFTFGPEADIGHVNFALDGETLQQVGGEEVDKGGVLGLIIDLEIPPILVTLDSEL